MLPAVKSLKQGVYKLATAVGLRSEGILSNGIECFPSSFFEDGRWSELLEFRLIPPLASLGTHNPSPRIILPHS